MNLANRLTLARIVLIPVFMTVLLLKVPKGYTLFPHQEIVAAVIFILAAATDGLDGYIARKRNQVTNLGKFMDPLADKLLVSAALISLVQLGQVNAWIAWTILAREFAVTGLRMVASVDRVVISASKLGKIKTITQVVAISALLLQDWPLSLIGIHIGQPLLYIALFFTVISGLDYFRKSRKLLRK
ncbi:CDP-diacylglycerol--glycerol-3-phosphate 3-phosphatidyltransferase [Desulfosporosinus sp. BICA1-9]|uniref:CDP-diacylglycerol--glycerol-3-phosphate 3-phosphatidyltransferase n=1 Tax=Desulfosporosinus sp. BICA1-9 TaxID=1531958 RepID=UPI00054B473D|nr:CDP-diacylglycerol--glycerol-3-phosphate 3-phosphatidyltransferase [Desulfosporosinus sp. BICA1-9]KJS77886.1 MAG: CDP-diacylglycerol--glycerol-3-phosphate 3-phosphatidyltransferase [Desulfosporosinus sp. BICA1-9]HBW34593.1 CDP-diacylglycerol--glycerol-3-phosphate 3-phosphatidyltransferase [Desulfosporosinus sp.]